MATATETTPQVGDIYAASWGYDETHVDFYEVVDITPSGKSVKIYKIASEVVNPTGGPVEYVKPVPGHPVGDEILTRRIKDGYVKINSYTWGFLTDPEATHYVTGFGWGR